MIDLDPADLSMVKKILAEHVPHCEVRVFGSRVTQSAKVFSDLDLAIVCDAPMASASLALIRDALEASDLPIKVDVLDWWSISPSFRDVIDRHYVVLQERSG